LGRKLSLTTLRVESVSTSGSSWPSLSFLTWRTSHLRACDLTKLRVRDVAHGEHVSSRAIVMQQKTQRPVQFEITEQTRLALQAWIHEARLHSEDCLFPSRLHVSAHLSTRQYVRIVKAWIKAIGLDPAMYGTHTMRRTKASLIYRRTKSESSSASARPYQA